MEKPFLKILIILFFVVVFSDYYSYLTSPVPPNYFYYEKNLATALQWVKNNTEKDAIIIFPWGTAHPVVGIAERRVIVTSKAYPSEAPMIAERFKDLARITFSTSDEDALKILGKYNATYIFLDKVGFNYDICWYIGECEKFQMNEQIKDSVFQTYLFTKLTEGHETRHFKLVYNSADFLIYKVIK